MYFKAPAKFLGDKRRAYQHKFTFFLQQEHADNPFDTIKGDVILKGKWFSEDLVHNFDKRPGDEFSEFSVGIKLTTPNQWRQVLELRPLQDV